MCKPLPPAGRGDAAPPPVPARLARLTAALALATLAPAAVAAGSCNVLAAAACSHTGGSGDRGPDSSLGVTVEGGSACSGVLLARTDGGTDDMRVLVAEHCLPGGVSTGGSVGVRLYFNALGGCRADTEMQGVGEVARQQLAATATVLTRSPLFDAAGNPTGNDSALLRVAVPAPEGAWYAGWNGDPLVAGTAVEALGHGRGQQLSLAAGTVALAPRPTTDFFQVDATRGMIVFGHSGTPVYDAAARLVGLVSDASCTPDGSGGTAAHEFIAGRFDRLLPGLRAHLDPLGSGTRQTAGYPATGGAPLTAVSASTRGLSSRIDAAPVPEGPSGRYLLAAEFCNTGAKGIRQFTHRVASLTGGNSLISRTRAAPAGAPGGVGAQQRVAATGANADGLLAGGAARECVRETSVIGLASRARFTFTIDLLGVPEP